jgi:hypothetical protein
MQLSKLRFSKGSNNLLHPLKLQVAQRQQDKKVQHYLQVQ